MAIEYASKYSAKVDERFTIASLTDRAVNQDYEFTGVDTVKVYSVPTVALGNYSLTGTSRYGTPTDLQNEVQTLVLTQDKAFTFVIDRKSLDDTQGAMEAGRALRRQVDEVIIPTVDKYRLGVMAANAGGSATGTLTKSNVYEAVLTGMAAMTDAGVPMTDRILYLTSAAYTLLKQDASFVRSGDVSQDMLIRGSLGMVDGANVVPVPAAYLGEGVNFVLTHKVATVAPVKLESYKTHDNPPGINGVLVEGRVRYDAFVLDNKAAAVYVHKTA